LKKNILSKTIIAPGSDKLPGVYVSESDYEVFAIDITVITNIYRSSRYNRS